MTTKKRPGPVTRRGSPLGGTDSSPRPQVVIGPQPRVHDVPDDVADRIQTEERLIPDPCAGLGPPDQEGRPKVVAELQQIQEFINGQTGMANQCAESADGLPPDLLEGLDCLLAGDIPQLPHGLDRNDNRLLPGLWGMLGGRLHVLGLEPGRDRLFNVFQGFLFILTLGNAAWKCRTLGHDPAVLRLLERHVEDHCVSPRKFDPASVPKFSPSRSEFLADQSRLELARGHRTVKFKVPRPWCGQPIPATSATAGP